MPGVQPRKTAAQARPTHCTRRPRAGWYCWSPNSIPRRSSTTRHRRACCRGWGRRVCYFSSFVACGSNALSYNMDIEDTRGIDSLGICIVLAFAQRRADGCREEEGSTRRERGHGGIVVNKATLIRRQNQESRTRRHDAEIWGPRGVPTATRPEPGSDGAFNGRSYPSVDSRATLRRTGGDRMRVRRRARSYSGLFNTNIFFIHR